MKIKTIADLIKIKDKILPIVELRLKYSKKAENKNK